MFKRSRVQAGVPTGGEFAREQRQENDDLFVPEVTAYVPVEVKVVDRNGRKSTLDIHNALLDLDAFERKFVTERIHASGNSVMPLPLRRALERRGHPGIESIRITREQLQSFFNENPTDTSDPFLED